MANLSFKEIGREFTESLRDAFGPISFDEGIKFGDNLTRQMHVDMPWHGPSIVSRDNIRVLAYTLAQSMKRCGAFACGPLDLPDHKLDLVEEKWTHRVGGMHVRALIDKVRYIARDDSTTQVARFDVLFRERPQEISLRLLNVYEPAAGRPISEIDVVYPPPLAIESRTALPQSEIDRIWATVMQAAKV